MIGGPDGTVSNSREHRRRVYAIGTWAVLDSDPQRLDQEAILSQPEIIRYEIEARFCAGPLPTCSIKVVELVGESLPNLCDGRFFIPCCRK